MSGCAGGLSGGLWAAYGARLQPGASYVLELLEFERRLDNCIAAFSGEGCIDSQSLEGKAVGEVARICTKKERDLHILVGRDDLDRRLVIGTSVATIGEAGTLDAIASATYAITSAILD